jgi:Glycosyl hydrolase family 26
MIICTLTKKPNTMKKLMLSLSIVFLLTFFYSCSKKDAPAPVTPTVTTPVVVDPKAILADLLVDIKPVDRTFYNAKYEPTTGVYHGAGQDPTGFRDYKNAVGSGNHPIIYMSYTNLTLNPGNITSWGNSLQSQLNALPIDVMPQVGLELASGGKGKTVEIAKGDYDAQIDAFVAAIKNLDRKVFIRIGYEFEGSWNNYNAQGYVDSFIKITDKLRAAKTNSATVWCSAGGSAGFNSWANLEKYYPGDAYVDWFGIDVFDASELTDSRLTAFLTKADELSKPVMIGETTPTGVGAQNGFQSWNDWYRPFFSLVYTNPQIKAICYINWDWDAWEAKLNLGWVNWKDARIEKNDIVKMGCIQELQKPIFIHATVK